MHPSFCAIRFSRLAENCLTFQRRLKKEAGVSRPLNFRQFASVQINVSSIDELIEAAYTSVFSRLLIDESQIFFLELLKEALP